MPTPAVDFIEANELPQPYRDLLAHDRDMTPTLDGAALEMWRSHAVKAGQTLSDYLLGELERLAARPTREEMLSRLRGRKRVTLKTAAAAVIRQERESA